MNFASLAALLKEMPRDADRIALCDHDRATTWGELADEFTRQRQELAPLAGKRVGLALRADRIGLARLAALESLASDVFLLDAELPAQQMSEWAERFGLSALLSNSASLEAESFILPADKEASHDVPTTGLGSVTILTSGTTGEPKAVRHGWEGLVRPVRRQAGPSPPNWLLAYRPHLYAGLQVLFQALLNRGTLTVPEARAEPADVLKLMATSGVTHASATPSYWRRLLTWSDEELQRQVPLVQITLGGEVVDQAILDRLHRVYPDARLVHIYATTELGRCFSVTDGQAGFPAKWLGQVSADGIELEVRDGQLWVRSANAMSGYEAGSQAAGRMDAHGWFPTGDLIELRDDRCYFVGRRSDLINVGGNKVAPAAVERVIRQLDAVAEVRVFGQASSLAGQLVACQIVPAAGQSADVVRQLVREHCQSQLDRYQCPRLIEIVDRLPLTDAGKLSRSVE